MTLEEREGKEAAVRLDLHLPREPAGRRRIGLRGHSHGRRVAACSVGREGRAAGFLGFMPPGLLGFCGLWRSCWAAQPDTDGVGAVRLPVANQLRLLRVVTLAGGDAWIRGGTGGEGSTV